MSIYWLLIAILILGVGIYNFSIYYHNNIAIKPIRKKYNVCYYLRGSILFLVLIGLFLPQKNIFGNVEDKVSGLKSYINNILNNIDNINSNDEDKGEIIDDNEERDLLSFGKNCEWGKVDNVIDGDTIVVNSDKIRLLGIDTPETVAPDTPIQCYGPEASERMKQLTLGRKVCLIKDTISDDLDKYGRKLRYVYLENGKSVNETMLKESFSREYSKYDFGYKDKYKKIPDKAKEIGKGVYECPIEDNDNDTEEVESNKEKDNNKDELDIIKEKIEDNKGTLDGIQIKEFVVNETPIIETKTPIIETKTPIIETIKTNKNNCNIKGNISYNGGKKIYHLPGCPNYDDTVINTSKGERRFCTEAEARAAGWTKAKNCP